MWNFTYRIQKNLLDKAFLFSHDRATLSPNDFPTQIGIRQKQRSVIKRCLFDSYIDRVRLLWPAYVMEYTKAV